MTTTTTTIRTTSDSFARTRLPASLIVAFITAGCSSSGAKAPQSEAPLRSGPLTDFVPAAGLRWLAVARPADLANDAALRPLLGKLLPAERLDAFARSTGVDLRAIPNALAAGFDYGSLYAAETPFENRMIETRFVDRLASGATIESKHPRVRRLTGTVGVLPEALLRVDRRFVAFAVGDPSQARVVELFVLGRLVRSPSALRGTALKAVPADFAAAPLRFYAPGPFGGEWERGARGLLAAATGVGAAAVPKGDSLRIQVAVLGAYRGEDVARLSAVWDDLAESPMGRLTGLDQPISRPSVGLIEGRLTLQVEIALTPLFSGLRSAVAADVWEMLGSPQPEPARPSQNPKP